MHSLQFECHIIRSYKPLQDRQAMSWTMILDPSQAEAGGARASSSEGKHWWAIIQSERVAAGFSSFSSFILLCFVA